MAKTKKPEAAIIDLFGSVQVVPEVKPEPKKVIEKEPSKPVIVHLDPVKEAIKDEVNGFLHMKDQLKPGTAEYTAKWFPNGPTSLKKLKDRRKLNKYR
jgi:hypothetical protein